MLLCTNTFFLKKQLPPFLHYYVIHGFMASITTSMECMNAYLCVITNVHSNEHAHTHTHGLMSSVDRHRQSALPLQIFFALRILRVVLHSFGQVGFLRWHQLQEIHQGLLDISSKLVRILQTKIALHVSSNTVIIRRISTVKKAIHVIFAILIWVFVLPNLARL